MRKNISVNMVNTRGNKGQKAKEKVTEEPIIPARETDLETPNQSIDDKRRFSNKKNSVHREVCSDGRNETKRKRGGNTSYREKQNNWNRFHNNDRS